MTSQEWLAMSGLFAFGGMLVVLGLFVRANQRWKKRQIELGNITPDGELTEQFLTSERESRPRSSE